MFTTIKFFVKNLNSSASFKLAETYVSKPEGFFANVLKAVKICFYEMVCFFTNLVVMCALVFITLMAIVFGGIEFTIVFLILLAAMSFARLVMFSILVVSFTA